MENLAVIGITSTVTVVENNAFIDMLMNGNFNIAATHLNLNTDASNVFDVASIRGSAVSYTHLDVYKRQEYFNR